LAAVEIFSAADMLLQMIESAMNIVKVLMKARFTNDIQIAEITMPA